MKEFTQSSLGPVGNCWQTAVACLLEVEPSQLPDQSKLDRRLVDGQWVGQGFNNPLQAYLLKHHHLAYVEMHLPPEAYQFVRITGWHLMSGTTIRTVEPTNIRHMVVGRDGDVAWDPHPSRAGLLTDDIRYSFLVPYPKAWEAYKRDDMPCVCPACATETT